MKYIILTLLLLTACGKSSEEACYQDCNKIKPETPKDATSQTKKDAKRNSEAASSTQEDSSADSEAILLKGTTDKGQQCVITFPKNADSLSHFQVSVQIKSVHKNITVQSLVKVKVVRDTNDPSHYSSKSMTTSSVSLKFQSRSVISLSVLEKKNQKKYSCVFK